MTLFEIYEPHTEYVQAVQLRPGNFDALADELSRLNQGKYLVSKVIRYGDPHSLTLTPYEDSDDEPITCRLFQMFVQRQGKALEVVDRHELRHSWRRVAADPYGG